MGQEHASIAYFTFRLIVLLLIRKSISSLRRHIEKVHLCLCGSLHSLHFHVSIASSTDLWITCLLAYFLITCIFTSTSLRLFFYQWLLTERQRCLPRRWRSGYHGTTTTSTSTSWRQTPLLTLLQFFTRKLQVIFIFERSSEILSAPYLIFVIFFTRAKFLQNKIHTEKRQFFALNL